MFQQLLSQLETHLFPAVPMGEGGWSVGGNSDPIH
jgi:hypothetical protein